jgi:hypothetical protein
MQILDDYAERLETARQLKIKPRTLSSWTHQPDGIPHVRLGRRTLYHLPTVREWIEKRIRRPNRRRG